LNALYASRRGHLGGDGSHGGPAGRRVEGVPRGGPLDRRRSGAAGLGSGPGGLAGSRGEGLGRGLHRGPCRIRCAGLHRRLPAFHGHGLGLGGLQNRDGVDPLRPDRSGLPDPRALLLGTRTLVVIVILAAFSPPGLVLDPGRVFGYAAGPSPCTSRVLDRVRRIPSTIP